MNTNLLYVVLLAVVLLLGSVCLWQRLVIRRKNRALVRFITESYKYKNLYYEKVRVSQNAPYSASRGRDGPEVPTDSND